MSRPIIAAVLAVLLLSGCGGGSGTTTTEPASGVADRGVTRDAYVAKADRICSGMIADAVRMGVRFRKIAVVKVNALTLTTDRLVEPAQPILERSARRLRALEPMPADVKFESYVTLFDPIVSIVRERIRAGDAGDSTRAHELELLMVDLSEIQRRLAHEAGLQACDVDFIATFSSGKSER